MSTLDFITKRLWTSSHYISVDVYLSDVSGVFKNWMCKQQLAFWQRYKLQNLFCDSTWNGLLLHKQIDQLLAREIGVESQEEGTRILLIKYVLRTNMDKVLDLVLNKVSSILACCSQNHTRDMLIEHVFAKPPFHFDDGTDLSEQIIFKYMLIVQEMRNISLLGQLKEQTIDSIWINLVCRAVLEVVETCNVSLLKEQLLSERSLMIEDRENEQMEVAFSGIEDNNMAEADDNGDTEFYEIEETKEKITLTADTSLNTDNRNQKAAELVESDATQQTDLQELTNYSNSEETVPNCPSRLQKKQLLDGRGLIKDNQESERMEIPFSDIEYNDTAEADDDENEFCRIEETSEKIALATGTSLNTDNRNQNTTELVESDAIQQTDLKEPTTYYSSSEERVMDSPSQLLEKILEINWDNYEVVLNAMETEKENNSNLVTSQLTLSNHVNKTVLNKHKPINSSSRNSQKDDMEGHFENQIIDACLKPILTATFRPSEEITLEWKMPLSINGDHNYRMVGYDLFFLQGSMYTPNLAKWSKLYIKKEIEFPMVVNLRDFPMGFKYFFTVRMIVVKKGNEMIGPLSNLASVYVTNNENM